MTALLLDHLWQSTAVLAAIGLLTLFFRNNGAHVRHALWLAASLKFLIPFAALTALGETVSGLLASPLPAPPMIETLEVVAQPFSGKDVIPVTVDWLPFAAAAWVAGVLTLGAFWFSRWRILRAALHAARDTDIDAPMSVKLSQMLLEPGLIGIFHPTLLLPEGIADRLSPSELRAILAHETCHLRRRDNLTAALHMLVEAIFWFWPPVWWLGERLVLERERACDEAVVASGNDPQVYAESILKVCKFYVQSPLICAAGISGADLRKRMEEIMRSNVIARLSLSKKALLLSTGAAVVALPLSLGLPHVPEALAQTGLVPSASPLRHVTLNTAPRPAVIDNAPVRAPNSMQQPAGHEAAPVSSELMAASRPSSQVAQLSAPPAQGVAPCKAVPGIYAMTHTKPPMPETVLSGERFLITEVRVTVGPDGSVRDIVISRPSGSAPVDEAAVTHIRQNWRWEPTICGGSVIAPVRIIQEVLPLQQSASTGSAPAGSLAGQTAQATCVPAPIQATHTRPPYPVISAQTNETGTVVLRAYIGADGRVNHIGVIESSGYGRLDVAAAIHVKDRWLWQPNNCASSSVVPVRIVFALADGRATTTVP
jgi:TonB family protein